MSKLDRAVDVAGALLPELVMWVRAMIAAGRSVPEMRKDIRDRTAQVEANRTERDSAFREKFGDPDGTPTR